MKKDKFIKTCTILLSPLVALIIMIASMTLIFDREEDKILRILQIECYSLFNIGRKY